MTRSSRSIPRTPAPASMSSTSPSTGAAARTSAATQANAAAGTSASAAKRMPRLIAVAAASLAAATLLTGCGSLEALSTLGNPVGRDLFDSAQTFEKSAAAKSVGATWIPDDASKLRITYRNNGTAALLMFTSATSLDTLCTTTSTVPTPALEDSWWPQSIPPEAYLCGDSWTAFTADGVVYAFTGTDTTTAGAPVKGNAGG